MKYVYSINLFLIINLIIANYLPAQIYLGCQIKGNYWEHTLLYGTSIGANVAFPFGKLGSSLILSYDFGFGSFDRMKKFKSLNDNYWTTVFVDKGNWHTTEGLNTSPSILRKPKADYAKENRLSCSYFFPLKSGKSKGPFEMGIGASVAFVEHFFTFTDSILYNINIAPFYVGPLNYIPVSQSKFMTFSLVASLRYKMTLFNLPSSAIISVGYGPKKSSFATIGVVFNTLLLKK